MAADEETDDIHLEGIADNDLDSQKENATRRLQIYSLMTAAQTGNRTAVERILQQGVDANSSDANGGWTALHLSASNGRERCTRLLLEAGGLYDKLDKHGFSPVHYAVLSGRARIAKLLLDHCKESGHNVNAAVNSQGKHGWSPLHLSAFQGYKSCVECLLDEGADPELPDIRGWTALQMAVAMDRIKCATILLRKGAKPDSEQSKPSALCYSISLGHERCTKLLLKNGASVNLQGEGGRGALHEAALRNDVDAVRSLVVRGADVNMKDENGITPLGVCKALRSHKKCYQILQHMASEPLPLQQLCRLQINKYIDRTSKEKYIKKLPIPKLLKDYLLYKYDR